MERMVFSVSAADHLHFSGRGGRTENLMTTRLLNARNGLRRTTLGTLLVLLCAIVAACHADASARANANPKKPPENVNVNALAGMEPVQPFDEKLVTPMETVGASPKD